jgi:pimeloyl-ACP methyl ester carboxylesterase
MARRPERIGRVVLASCDALETFLPQPFTILPRLAALPGPVWLLVQTVRLRALHRLPLTFGWVAKRPIPPEVTDSYLLPSRRDPAIRRDLRRFLRGVHRRHTLKAAESFGDFTKPVLLVWAAEERLFPVTLARKLAAMLSDAHLTLVADSYTFLPEDQPAELARHILEFLKA